MKRIICAVIAAVAVLSIALICGCSKKEDSGLENKKYDLSLPVLNENGWYLVFRMILRATP